MNIDIEFDDLPPLQERCRCASRPVFVDGKEAPCQRGCVNGQRPTEFGRAVLELVRTFIKTEECP